MFACTQRSADGCSCLLARVPGTDVRTRWLPFFWVLCCGGDRDRPASRLSVQTQIKGTPDLMKTRAAASNHTKQQRTQGTRRAATRTRTEDERVPNERRRQGRQAAAGRADALREGSLLLCSCFFPFKFNPIDRDRPRPLDDGFLLLACIHQTQLQGHYWLPLLHTHGPPLASLWAGSATSLWAAAGICALGLFDSLSPVRPIYTFSHLLKQRQST